MAGAAIGNTGGGQPHDNVQPFLVINYIIALEGIYPSQSSRAMRLTRVNNKRQETPR